MNANISDIAAWRRPGCGDLCTPRWHSPVQHEAHGMALALLAQRVEPVRVVRTGPLVIDLAAATVTVDGEPVRLSGREWALLACLAVRAGQHVSNDDIVRHVMGDGYLTSELRNGSRAEHHIVNINICRLRRKLGAAASLVTTVSFNGFAGRRLELVETRP